MADTGFMSAAPTSFTLPTMRGAGAPIYNQQYIMTPAAQPWEIQEQSQLEKLNRNMCFPNESLMNRSIKIAAHLGKKTVRDVAARLKTMEENSSGSSRPQDDVDRVLSRTDAILAELQSIPSRNRTEAQTERLHALIREFIANTKDTRTKLDQKSLKIPVQFVPSPELPESLRNVLTSASAQS